MIFWRAVAAILLMSPTLAAAQVDPERFTLVLGDMRPGSGLAAGFEYFENHFRNGWFDLRLRTQWSIRLYQQHEAEIVFPHLLGEKLFVEALGLYRSYTEVRYFGIGPDTPEQDETNYRLSGPALLGTIGIRPHRKLAVGARVGTLRAHLGPGRDDDVPSSDQLFESSQLPGFAEEPDHFLLGSFLTLDLRNDREEPTAGGYYEIQANRYRDTGSNGFDFQEMEAEARHYLRAGKRFTFALRAQGVFTWTREGQEVPFFLLPSLGGRSDLIAFENDRFRDRNLLFFGNELRYAASPEVRITTFVDFGQVFPRWGELELDRFALSTGLGAHYKYGRSVLVGASLGVGREGARVAITGNFRF